MKDTFNQELAFDVKEILKKYPTEEGVLTLVDLLAMAFASLDEELSRDLMRHFISTEKKFRIFLEKENDA